MDNSDLPDYVEITENFSECSDEYRAIEEHYLKRTVELDYSKCGQKATNVSGTLEKITGNSITLSNSGTIYSKRILPAMIVRLKE